MAKEVNKWKEVGLVGEFSHKLVANLGKAWISAAFDFAVHNLLVFGCLQRCSSFRDRFSDVKVEAKTLREGSHCKVLGWLRGGKIS
ncbi:hypothetical protein L3X38_019648 [Prunus dulcis]|uniref:Uncharacterized protein n=1 Tax=Prunus dulcis TaxID=3755 RepID=A0AAD4ZC87_PRUDU|nr:hypothetical protein L3X38_019648 [Prunus dulcis]